MEIPSGYKKCSKGEKCINPNGSILPATTENFRTKARGDQYGLYYVCKVCERAIDKERPARRSNRKNKRKAVYKPRTLTQRIKKREIDKRYEAQNKDKRRAKYAVKHAVEAGKLPHISTCLCRKCGAKAKEYHHWSYKKEHWIDVVPLCKQCHTKEHYAPA